MRRGGRGPCHERLAEERGALPAPVDPRIVAAACSHRREARGLLTLVGRGGTVALVAAGDEEAGSTNGSSSWHGS
jgi:hypothetical protein